MKAKNKVPENHEQPKPLPASPIKEEKLDLAGWQKEIIALAEARLSIDGEQDVVCCALRRVIALSRCMQDMLLERKGDDVTLHGDALYQIMEDIEENAQVVKWLTDGRPSEPRWS